MKFVTNLLGTALNLATVVALASATMVAALTRNLPDHRTLTSWEPAVTTRLYASDGTMVGEFARERRLFLPIGAIPARVRQAFLSAEDKNFYTHPGIDLASVGTALVANLANYGSGRRMIGGSTITQQIAKNFLLTSDRTVERKLREAILSLRIDQTYSKDRILELYLNDIYLGLGAYGVAQAALTYFDKPVGELSVSQAAFLAALPKGPNNYDPYRQAERATGRRNWVIEQMRQNGFIDAETATKATATPLGVKSRMHSPAIATADYFTEDVRRQLNGQYGDAALYTAGFSVRTTLDPRLQNAAMKALRKGLVAYDQAKGYRGPIERLPSTADWSSALAELRPLSDVPEWRLGVVLAAGTTEAEIGLRPQTAEPSGSAGAGETIRLDRQAVAWALCRSAKGSRGCAASVDGVLSPGDVVYVEKQGGGYVLRQPPLVQGALVSMDPNTGRVLAVAGGFSYAQSEFNRATQAYRQPGSSFKPFVYAAALDNGYAPTTLVMDAPIALADGAGRTWKPKNYDGRFSGPSTLRVGLENSRNLMTVRLARHLGMDLVADYGKRFGIYDELKPYVPMSLGAGETTLLRLVSAYAVIANGGKAVTPSMIDRIQDRYGRTIFRHDQRGCDDCNVSAWSGQEEPVPVDDREYVLDPMTAFQVTSMLRGVVERGTARNVSSLGVPIAGKTGTTNDEKDVWFVGFTPNIVTGVFLGYDTPKPMGNGETGGGLAAPIFIDFMKTALQGQPVADFHAPAGMMLEAIDRKSGQPVPGGTPGAIIEAFKPGTAPCASGCPIIDGFETASTSATAEVDLSPELREKLLTNGNGLY
ncbi:MULTISPECIES: penicillin-binding protein 1A [unclassified Ensifer]|uniref:penicillin-binding protein 1A n=1 Tax=unclassified Ensifer TaxID=2633371 RepID=UPI000812F28A|nr:MULTISPECIES: penicillin-binding protein 1A [unclassified Ensifer]OCO99919.1 penicillin-binding protein [Ensifer sp. LC13]OCP00139.1 penicillin-binding protein [Ensifer sp. LC11]OCP04005.1 penicillin-binding protein [Ensifer sp. LC14]OCP31032.1 penicillin-binding protein [Ensifer sp. LC499]